MDNLHEVEPTLLRHGERLLGRHDAELLALIIDDPHLWDTDHLVHAQVSADVFVPSFRGGKSRRAQSHDRRGRRGRIAQGFEGRQRRGGLAEGSQTVAPERRQTPTIAGVILSLAAIAARLAERREDPSIRLVHHARWTS